MHNSALWVKEQLPASRMGSCSSFLKPTRCLKQKKFGNLRIIFIFATDIQSAHARAGGCQHWGQKTFSRCLVRSLKGVYERYRSVISNFATLRISTEVMQRNVRVGVLYSSDNHISVIYGVNGIIICLGVGWLRCLSLERGNAKARDQGWAEVGTPMPFLFPQPSNQLLTARQGSSEGTKTLKTMKKLLFIYPLAELTS